MEKTLKQILQEQVMLEFHQKELDDLIVFFMAKYPNFPYTELASEQLIKEYLNIYETSFLASYIRYSDRTLLGSGMRDEFVREKLCFLHFHIGTILPVYRKFIWSDDITLEDLKRWLPLFSNFKLKNRLMQCTKITEDYISFVNLCLNQKSFEYQNLVLLDELYSNAAIELEQIAIIKNQEELYKLLTIVKQHRISISYEQLLECFYKIEQLLTVIPMNLLSQYSFIFEEYLREPFYFPAMESFDDFLLFRQTKEIAHRQFLEREFDLYSLKEFYCKLFLGICYSEFYDLFLRLPDDKSEEYQLLYELYETKFPLCLKENFYERCMNFGDLKYYWESVSLGKNFFTKDFLCSSLPFFPENSPVITLQGLEFGFIISKIEEYQKSQNTISAILQSSTGFSYEKGCWIAFSNPTVLSCCENACVLSKPDLKPSFLIAFDNVSFEHLKYHSMLSLPIVLIDTESYVKQMVQSLEKLYDAQDWDSYRKEKLKLFHAIRKHPWLFTKYFNLDTLYRDVKILQERLEEEIIQKLPLAFLKERLHILEQLISLNEELEAAVTKEKKISFQYRKKMIQYVHIKG